MDIYFYSPIKALLSSNQFVPTTIEQNPLYHNGTKGFYARYDYGLKYEPSIVYFDDKFYKNIAIIDLYKGFLVLPKLVKTYNLPYKIIDKQSIVCAQIECFVTCYQQGGAYLKIDGYNQSTTLELPFVPNKIELYNLGSNVFIIKAINKLCFFAIINGYDTSVLLSDLCDGVSTDNQLVTTKIYKGIAKHVKTTVYGFDGGFYVDNESFKSEYKTSPLDAVLPLAFLEEVRLCVDYRHFLCDELLKDSNLIGEFLGKFNLFLPPLLKEHSDNFLLINDTCRFVKIKAQNGKITDVCLEDFPF